jgi:hypothetical protein
MPVVAPRASCVAAAQFTGSAGFEQAVDAWGKVNAP